MCIYPVFEIIQWLELKTLNLVGRVRGHADWSSMERLVYDFLEFKIVGWYLPCFINEQINRTCILWPRLVCDICLFKKFLRIEAENFMKEGWRRPWDIVKDGSLRLVPLALTAYIYNPMLCGWKSDGEKAGIVPPVLHQCEYELEMRSM